MSGRFAVGLVITAAVNVVVINVTPTTLLPLVSGLFVGALYSVAFQLGKAERGAK